MSTFVFEANHDEQRPASMNIGTGLFEKIELIDFFVLFLFSGSLCLWCSLDGLRFQVLEGFPW